MKNETFVIRYKYIAGEEIVIWYGSSVEDALQSFWKSFDYDDREFLSDVRIYDLVERICDTSYQY